MLHRSILRRFSSSVLGTETFSANFVESLRTEMAEAERERRGATRDMWTNCIRKGELDHMESPEADEKQKMKIDRLAATLFSKVPTPADPMKAALAKTREEAADYEELEALKETMRERYRNKNLRSRNESKRIDVAMEQVRLGTHRLQQEQAQIDAFVDADEGESAAAQKEAAMQAEIAAMKRKIAMLEQQLADKGPA